MTQNESTVRWFEYTRACKVNKKSDWDRSGIVSELLMPFSFLSVKSISAKLEYHGIPFFPLIFVWAAITEKTLTKRVRV